MESSMSGITVESAGRMTTYELRQEIESRGLAKDLEEINHATLLRRLVQDLVEEDHKRGQQKVQESADVVRSAQERLRQERMERKAAAIERSKLRQVEQDYFLSKKMSNVKPKMEKQDSHDSSKGDDEKEEYVQSTANPRRHKPVLNLSQPKMPFPDVEIITELRRRWEIRDETSNLDKR